MADREGQRVLLTYGTIIDSITQATGTPELSGNPVNYPGWPEDKAILLRHERNNVRVAYQCKRYDNESRGAAHRKTLIASLGPGRAAVTASESSLESYEEWLTWLDKGAAGDCKTPAPDYAQLVSVSEAFCATQFCTSQTGYMCLASEDTKPDDLICVMTGIQVPIIIRAHDDSSFYEIISPCYVHGIMGGEEAPMDNPFQIEMYMDNEPPPERVEALSRAHDYYRVNTTPNKNLGPIYDLYRNFFTSRQLYDMGLPPRRITGRLTLVLGEFSQALHTRVFLGYEQPFHLDAGDFVWIFNTSPLSCIGINARGEI